MSEPLICWVFVLIMYFLHSPAFIFPVYFIGVFVYIYIYVVVVVVLLLLLLMDQVFEEYSWRTV